MATKQRPQFWAIPEPASPPSKAKIFLDHLKACAHHFDWGVTDDGMIVGVHKSNHQLYTPLSAVCLIRHQRDIGVNDYYRAAVLLELNEGEVEILYLSSTSLNSFTNIPIRNDFLSALGLQRIGYIAA